MISFILNSKMKHKLKAILDDVAATVMEEISMINSGFLY